MSAHEPSHHAAGIPLKAHVEDLRRRCEAVSRFQGGATDYQEELGILRNYTDEAGLSISKPPDELNRAPDDEGDRGQPRLLRSRTEHRDLRHPPRKHHPHG